MSYNSGSNRARNFKSASRFALFPFFKLLARLLPKLYSTRSNYLTLVTITITFTIIIIIMTIIIITIIFIIIVVVVIPVVVTPYERP